MFKKDYFSNEDNNVILASDTADLDSQKGSPVLAADNPNERYFQGVAICNDHDPAKWHSLVKRNSDRTINCTYTHEHKDDPRALNGLFGAVNIFTQNQEISYPWQTHSHLGDENVAKHRVYNWEVVKDSVCKPSFAPLGFTNIRREMHLDGNSGATVRFHSFFLQAEGCDPKDPSWRGKITIGGVIDFGHLEIPDGNIIKLPDDPGPDVNPSLRRAHMSTTPSSRNGDFTWYGSNCTLKESNGICVQAGGGIRKEDWGVLDPKDPSQPILTGKGLNGSYLEPAHLVVVTIPKELDSWDGNVDGYVTYSGFTNKNGNIDTNCKSISSDCIPLRIENMKIGSYQYRNDANNLGVREYDVRSPNGQSLIDYPN